MTHSQHQTPDKEIPLLIVHRDGSVQLNGSEAEIEIALGKALGAIAYGAGLQRIFQEERK